MYDNLYKTIFSSYIGADYLNARTNIHFSLRASNQIDSTLYAFMTSLSCSVVVTTVIKPVHNPNKSDIDNFSINYLSV